MAVGDLGKEAIKACKNVYDGMSGKYGSFAVKEGEKILKSNMSSSQAQRVNKVMKNAADKGIMKNGKRVFGEDATKVAKEFMTEKTNKVNSMSYKFGNAVGGGIRDTAKSLKSVPKGTEGRFTNALDKGFKKNVLDATGKVVDRDLDVGKVAGAAFGVGVAGRLASGGGLYKDKNGNTNLPGVPFL